MRGLSSKAEGVPLKREEKGDGKRKQPGEERETSERVCEPTISECRPRQLN